MDVVSYHLLDPAKAIILVIQLILKVEILTTSPREIHPEAKPDWGTIHKVGIGQSSGKSPYPSVM